MALKEDVKSITYLKTRTADLIREVSKSARPVAITQSGEAKVVMMDVGTYDRWRSALALHKLLAHSEADARHRGTVSQKEAFLRAEAAIGDHSDDE